jgi:hypothetical protein
MSLALGAKMVLAALTYNSMTWLEPLHRMP